MPQFHYLTGVLGTFTIDKVIRYCGAYESNVDGWTHFVRSIGTTLHTFHNNNKGNKVNSNKETVEQLRNADQSITYS